MSTPRSGSSQRGQAMILFALMLPVMLGAIALVMDLGYGFVERRDLQNSADLGAVAAANYIGGTPTPSDAQVVNILNDLVDANTPLPNVQWTAVYWNSTLGTSLGPVGLGIVPPTTDGIRVVPTVQSATFFAPVLGATLLNVSASGGAVPAINSNSPGAPLGGGQAPAIVSLDAGSHIWPHSIISDASGTFTITNGGIVANDCYGSWDQTGTWCSDNGGYTDVVDAKEGSRMDIAGQFITASGAPFDGHFSSGSGGFVGATNAQGNYSSGTTTITYAGGLKSGQAYHPDPLRWLHEPEAEASEGEDGEEEDDEEEDSEEEDGEEVVAEAATCPGEGVQTFSGSSYAGAIPPGVYTARVTMSNVTLQDCGNGVPGIYIFQQGAVFTGSVTGSNVMLYSHGAMPPSFYKKYCYSPTSQPNNGAAQTNEPHIGSSSGLTSYGLIFTGHTGSVNLSAPTSGPYRNVVLFQSRAVPANLGFRICPGDSGNVNLTGTVYAHNQNDVPNNSTNAMSVNNTWWTTAGSGSALVFGTDDNYQDGRGNPTPTYGGGNLYIDGCAVVDVFYTTGNANVTIQYDTNHVPQSGTRLIN